MKYMFYFSMLFLFFTTSCKKEESDVTEPPITPDPPIIELGKSSFLMNDEKWLGSVIAYYIGEIDGRKIVRLLGKRDIPNSLITEYVSISDFFLKEGKYNFNCSCDSTFLIANGSPKMTMFWMLDGDQQYGAAHIDTTYTGSYIEVLKYDSVQQTIEGRFEAHLKDREATGPNPYYPTEVHLTEGKFNLKIEQ